MSLPTDLLSEIICLCDEREEYRISALLQVAKASNIADQQLDHMMKNVQEGQTLYRRLCLAI